MKNKIVFMGTPKFADIILQNLVESGYCITAVLAQPDKEIGRGRIKSSPVTINTAKQLNIPTYQPATKEEITQTITKLAPDLIIVASYGKIIPKETLEIPESKTLNVHGSLLPLYRGGSCIPAAIINGDTKTGITIMEVDERLDAGDIVAQAEIVITKNDTTETLTDKLAKAGASKLIEILPGWFDGKIRPIKQDEVKAVFCPLMRKDDGKINWQEPAEIIERKIRAYQPWPTAFTNLRGRQIKILEAEETEMDNLEPGEVSIIDRKVYVGTGTKDLQVTKMQPEGKVPMTAADIINGRGIINGDFLV